MTEGKPRSPSERPIRILHVLGGLDPGGVETWLLNILRHIDRDRFRMDFLVHTDRPCLYDAEVRGLGARIFPCTEPGRPLLYGRKFRRILREQGPYDVVHSHVHHFSGYVLRLARQEGVPKRIAHSHNDTTAPDAAARGLRRGYLALMKRWIRENATRAVAASRVAGVSLYGGLGNKDPGWAVLYCGIDPSPFRARVDPAEVRSELRIPSGAFVVGHVGRFCEQKNHGFLLQIATELFALESSAFLLLVGDGPLRPVIANRVEELGVGERVRFLGIRRDVARLMCGAMDVLVMPSLHEGLPVAGIEAQAAGLPMVLSEAITDEFERPGTPIRRLSLADPPGAWARALVELRRERRNPRDTVAEVERSPWSIFASLAGLADLYSEKADSIPPAPDEKDSRTRWD